MLISYTENKFPEDYVSTVFDNFEALQVVDGKTVHLQLWDTAGQAEYDRLRPLSFQETDVFIICFAVNSKQSFENVKTRWYLEIKEYAKTAPIILVGTKGDLRSSSAADDCITDSDAQKLVEELNLFTYIECSSRTQQNLSTVFDTAARAALNKQTNVQQTSEGGCCNVL